MGGEHPTRPDGWYCGAKKKKGGTCGQRAGAATNHPGVGKCWLHGGASPQAELSGQLVIARREATVMGVPLPIEPSEAILQCIAIAAGEVRYAAEQVDKLTLDDAVGRVVKTTERPLSLGKEGEDPEHMVIETRHEAPALHIWIVTKHAAMDRLVQYSVAALKAGVEERRVRVAENIGQALADAIKGVLADLGVGEDPRAPAVVRKHLTMMAGAG